MLNSHPFRASPLNQGPEKLYMYDFCPRGCLADDKRDFQVTLYSDNTLLWDDVRCRYEIIGIEAALLGDIFGREERSLSKEEQPFVIRTKASVGVITMVNRIKTIQSAKKALAAATVEPLDRHLDAIFWPEVNPKLPEPLRKRQCGPAKKDG
jgi:hypothetical protein